jgi:hypothetical protein
MRSEGARKENAQGTQHTINCPHGLIPWLLAQALPKLFSSLVSGCWVQRLHLNTKREEMFFNFRISQRGSIRRPPSSLTWALSLRSLAEQYGEKDAAVVIKQWNTMSAKSGQLGGGKVASVRNLLEACPPAALNMIIQHVHRHGWDNCAFSDDSLGSKKIWPGWQFRCTTSKTWTNRLKVGMPNRERVGGDKAGGCGGGWGSVSFPGDSAECHGDAGACHLPA